MDQPSAPESLPPLGTGLVVLIVVQILYGLGLCCNGLVGVAVSFLPDLLVPFAHAAGPGADLLGSVEQEARLQYASAAQNGLAGLCGVGFFVGGIGLARRAFWGRGVTVGSAIADLALDALQLLVTVFWLYPLLAGPLASADAEKRWEAIAWLGGWGASAVFGAIYPIVALGVLSRASVRARFPASSAGR